VLLRNTGAIAANERKAITIRVSNFFLNILHHA